MRFKSKAIFDGGVNIPTNPGAGKVLTSDASGDGTWQAGGSGTIYDTDAVGTVKAFAGSVIPTNWMLADGRAISRGAYVDLFNAIGTTYGVGDGSTTFNIPDLLSRMIVGAGAGAGLTARTAGTEGGEEKHILTIAELAAHAHTMVAGGQHDHQLNTAGNGVSAGSGGGYSGAMSKNSGTSVGFTNDANPGTHTHTINNSGSGTAHENMPPWCAIAYIIKATGVQVDSGGALVGATGPQGIQGPQGPQGVQGPTGPTGPAFTTAEDGVMDFSTFGSTFACTSGAWSTPGWFTPIIVGPAQTWEITAQAGVYCVTAVGNLSSRVKVQDSSGGAQPSNVTLIGPTNQMTHPNTSTFMRGMFCFGRIKTDGTVVDGTTLRVTQDFFASDANSRIGRDGTYYKIFAWRRV